MRWRIPGRCGGSGIARSFGAERPGKRTERRWKRTGGRMSDGRWKRANGQWKRTEGRGSDGQWRRTSGRRSDAHLRMGRALTWDSVCAIWVRPPPKEVLDVGHVGEATTRKSEAARASAGLGRVSRAGAHGVSAQRALACGRKVWAHGSSSTGRLFGGSEYCRGSCKTWHQRVPSAPQCFDRKPRGGGLRAATRSRSRLHVTGSVG